MGAWQKVKWWFTPKAKREDRLVVADSWLGQYGGQAAWDPNAPAMELPLYGQAPSILVSSVAKALGQLEQGSFYSAALLWDGMLRDDRITATLNVRLSGLLGAKLDLLPADDSDAAEAIKEKYEKKIARIFPSPQLAHLIRNGIGLSAGVAQVLSTRTTKARDAQIRVWNNRHLRYDWLLRQYRLVTENRGEITLDPEDDEWVIYEPYGPHGWLHGALIRPLAAPWLIRHWTRTWWARRQEVHGSPMRAGIIPAERDPADEKVFLRQLANLAHESTIRLPQGADGNKFDVKLIEAAAANTRGFLDLLEHCDASIATTLLGQHQSTDGQGGLGTQEKAGESTLQRILRGDALVGETLRDQVLTPLVRDNEGAADLAPYLRWQLDPPEDQSKKAKALLDVAQACVQFEQSPTFRPHIEARALLEEFQVPLTAEPPATESEDVVDRDDATDDTETTLMPNKDAGARDDNATPSDDDAGQDASDATLALTATDIASIVTVDEGRKSIGLGSVGGDIGQQWIREHAARLAAVLPAPTDDAQGGDQADDDNEQGAK